VHPPPPRLWPTGWRLLRRVGGSARSDDAARRPDGGAGIARLGKVGRGGVASRGGGTGWRGGLGDAEWAWGVLRRGVRSAARWGWVAWLGGERKGVTWVGWCGWRGWAVGLGGSHGWLGERDWGLDGATWLDGAAWREERGGSVGPGGVARRGGWCSLAELGGLARWGWMVGLGGELEAATRVGWCGPVRWADTARRAARSGVARDGVAQWAGWCGSVGRVVRLGRTGWLARWSRVVGLGGELEAATRVGWGGLVRWGDTARRAARSGEGRCGSVGWMGGLAW
jgi:hypothetical protein